VIHHYRLTIQYKGTQYLGWQVQPEGAGKTVQGELNRALAEVSKSTKLQTMGSGRTDAGVHALGQIVKASIELAIDPLKLIPALNVKLPDDIRVVEASVSAPDFMPTVHAKSKEYHYRFTCQRMFTAFQNELIVNYPFELHLEKMREACQLLIGEHDFTNFYCEGTEVSSNIRTIFECEILKIEQAGWGMLPEHFVFRIVGNGFLKQMVRLLMGAIWNVGRGKISLQDLQAALSAHKCPRLGPVAPPHGLYMVRVNY
jgi:tRNA pseudouridine38-40 synthase